MSRYVVRGVAVGLLALGLVVAEACRPDDQRTETLDPQGASTRAQLPAEVVEALDSGNAAYRERRFEDALEHYRTATDAAPDEPAGWFGIYMAQSALGDSAAADSALARTRDIAPGATILHGSPEDTLP